MNIEFIDLTEVQKDVVHCYAHRTGNEKKSMDYSEQRVRLHEIKCKMKMFVYQIEKGNTFAWDEYEAIGDIYFIKDGDSYFENGVLNREKFGTGGEMFF